MSKSIPQALLFSHWSKNGGPNSKLDYDIIIQAPYENAVKKEIGKLFGINPPAGYTCPIAQKSAKVLSAHHSAEFIVAGPEAVMHDLKFEEVRDILDAVCKGGYSLLC